MPKAHLLNQLWLHSFSCPDSTKFSIGQLYRSQQYISILLAIITESDYLILFVSKTLGYWETSF